MFLRPFQTPLGGARFFVDASAQKESRAARPGVQKAPGRAGRQAKWMEDACALHWRVLAVTVQTSSYLTDRKLEEWMDGWMVAKVCYYIE